MTDQLRIDGVDVAPGVLETIVTLAAEGVEGIAGIDGGSGIKGLMHKGSSRGVTVCVAEDGSLSADVHVLVEYGRPIHEVGGAVQRAVADALSSQTGQRVGDVDVYVDAIAFDR